MKDALQSFLEQQPTTIDADEFILKKLENSVQVTLPTDVSPFNYLCALRYRLTRKRVAMLTIAKLDAIIFLMNNYSACNVFKMMKDICKLWSFSDTEISIVSIPEEESSKIDGYRHAKDILITWKSRLNYSDFSYLEQLLESIHQLF